MGLNLQAGALLLFIVTLYAYVKRRGDRFSRALPPGPKKLPLIGNILDIPKAFEWKTYHRWSKQLNTDIIHLNMAGTSVIVLDMAKAAADLLENRSSIYSGRPRMPMMNELMGWDFHFGFMPYGDYWQVSYNPYPFSTRWKCIFDRRQNRRTMHQSFNITAAKRFHPHELKATHKLLRRVLNQPDNLIAHLKHMAGEVVMSIAYGIQVQEKDDIYIEAVGRANDALIHAAVPGTFLVDALPFLLYVPSWMPFAGFKRKAKEWRELACTMINLPYEAANCNIRSGDYIPSFVSYSLEEIDGTGNRERQEHIIKSIAGSMYSAGSDTTVAAIASCILGLLINPGALKKGQEIDRVVGLGQLPRFEDEEYLPYIAAIVKEALRWQPVAPIAVPHYLEVEDVYEGYRIPAGSIVIPNVWAMLYNEEIYPNPFDFDPDRFMKNGEINPDIKDPVHAAFGFGRRICPGRHMALSSIWITVASFIAAFDIEKAVDEGGAIVEPSHECAPGILSMPLAFKCSIKPRSSQIESLIRAAADEEY